MDCKGILWETQCGTIRRILNETSAPANNPMGRRYFLNNVTPERVDSLGAPKATLDYISKILAYRDQLILDYHDLYPVTSLLMTVDAHPVKDPNLL